MVKGNNEIDLENTSTYHIKNIGMTKRGIRPTLERGRSYTLFQ